MGFLNFFKLTQLITFYSDKKPIYIILWVIKQHADSTRVKQAKFHKGKIFNYVWGKYLHSLNAEFGGCS